MLRKHIDRIVRFPVTTILLALFVTAFFAYQIKGLHMVLDPKALLPQDHPYVKLNNEIEKQFGGSRVVIIGVASKDGDIFNPSDIEKIRRINEEVKRLPGILENNVVSIADRKVKYIKSEEDTLEIKGLLDGIEYTPEGTEELKKRVFSNPMFINSLISEDGTVAAIILDFRGGASDWWKKQPSAYNFLPSTSIAWAQEDWKKWQTPGSEAGEKSEVRGQRSEVGGQESGVRSQRSGEGSRIFPSPSIGEGQGAGKGKWPVQGQGKGKWPAGGEGGWAGGDKGAWPGGGGKDWEQWYVSDSTIHKNILEIVNKYKDENTDIYLSGLPIALSFLEADSWRMSRYIYPVAGVVTMFILYLAFQSIQGMLLPIVCAILSVIWAVGLMGLFRIPLDPWNMMTPILILAVAAGHSVQILKRYYEELERYGQVEDATHTTYPGRWGRDVSKQAVVESLTRIGPVMITAGLVAAASFASLVTFKLKTFQSFGLFTAFGILSALVLEMTFIPAARSLMKPPRKVKGRRLKVEGGSEIAKDNTPSTFLDRFLLSISGLVTRRGWLVWIGFVVIMAVAFYGINRLTVINSLKSLFFESTQFRKDDAALNKYFGGTATFYIYIEGDQPDSMKDPEVLRTIDALQREIESVPEVGKTQSYVDYVKAFNQSMHGGDAAYRTIPDSRATISEYLFLFSLSGTQGEMDRFLDYKYQKSVIWVFLRDDSTVLGKKLISIVDKYTPGSSEQAIEGGKQEIGGGRFLPGIKIGVAGSIPVMMALNETMVSGKIWNIIQIAAIVFVISSIVLRSIIGGILVLLPLIVAVFLNFGALGIMGIGLGVGTAAISAMAVGFGADYSIYLIYRLREEMRRQVEDRGEEADIGRRLQVEGGREEARGLADIDGAIRTTLLTAGKAIIFVAVALSAGALTLLFTGYYLHMEGFLVPLAMVTSSLASLIGLPTLIRLVKPGFIFR